MNPQPPDGVIWKSDLLRRLVQVAQWRAAMTMLAIVPVAIVLFVLLANHPLYAVAAVVGTGLAISFALTRLLCTALVKCPHCAHSLWDCGTGNFKPRRMRIRNDATGCPRCGARLV